MAECGLYLVTASYAALLVTVALNSWSIEPAKKTDDSQDAIQTS